MPAPSKFTQELFDEICARLSKGEPLAQICRDEGMPIAGTVRDWCDKDERLAIAYARARDEGFDAIALEALKTLSYAKSLAEPTLVAMNGQPANFLAGGQFPVPVVTGNTFSGLQGVTYIPYGVSLNFVPYITDRDRIRLTLNASVSTRDLTSATNIGGANVLGLNTRNVNTTVELRQGETLAVAGLIESNLGADSSRLPFIGDWPLIGVHAATTALGSLVLGLCLLHGRLDANAAVAASLLDELFEIERWGSDVEAERRHDVLRRDVTAAERFLQGLEQARSS